jgi:uncharacterized membrane protein YqjE
MTNHEKSHESQSQRFAQTLGEIKNEFIEFISTRIELFQSEVRETTATWKSAAPLLLAALVLLLMSFLLITLAVVALIAVAFMGNPYAWFFALVITGVVWGALGGIAAYLATNTLRTRGVFARKTIEVLKADRAGCREK